MADTAAPSTFEHEALPHLDTLYRVALRLTGEPAAAEDLVQETMLRALKAWSSFRPGSNARAWLVTILRNQFINGWRARKRAPTAVDMEALPEPVDLSNPDPEGRFFRELVDDEVLRAVDALPEEFREVLVLSDMEELPYAEIASALDIPVGTVKSRLFRARRILQGRLRRYAEEAGLITPRGAAE
ncbi:MAG TPA: sigma-70 family RNA polymerase sigma factor [Gemmatimonadales bacterium]|jgi:RNA polymerase sigma-70 factor (ECF subfamily)|nr:sigma-70 family RNA polymerase sigma factor [Gemmatimonadales bacterium]